MKFGIFYEISVPRPWEAETEYKVYQNCLEQVRLAFQEVQSAFVDAQRVLHIQQGERVLDIACGNGGFSRRMGSSLLLAERACIAYT